MAESGAVRKTKPLTLRERVFLSALFSCGMNATQAFIELQKRTGKPEPSREVAEVSGYKLRKQICAKAEFKEILAENGIDKATLAADLNRLRTIKRPAFNREGELVGEFDDGPTQLGTAKYIGDSLEVSSQKTSIELSGTLSIGLPPPPPAPDPAPDPEEARGA